MDESDLRSALLTLADRAPDPAQAAAQAHQRVKHIRTRRRRAGLVGVAAAVVVAAGASALVAGIGSTAPSPVSPPTASTSAASPSVPTPSAVAPSPTTAIPSSTNAAIAGLDIKQPWTLVGYDGYALVRIALDTGAESRTPLSVASSGPLYLLAQGDRTLVHPLDYVPAYIVVAGRAPQPSSGLFSDSGVMLPADDGRLWLEQSRNGVDQLVLFDWDGTMLGPTIDEPADRNGFPYSDGNGGALVRTTTGIYDLHPGTSVLITEDEVLAAGAGRFLTAQCAAGDCRYRVVDATGATISQVSTGATPLTAYGELGAISPDGSTAALAVYSGDKQATTTIALIDCATGRVRTVKGAVPVNGFMGSPSMVWAPDSSRLFVAGTDGSLSVVDALAGAVHRVPDVLSDSTNVQLAIVQGATGAASTGAAAQPLSGYTWTSQGTAPHLPVSVPIPAGYSASQLKFYPGLDYSTITYTSTDGDPPIQVSVGSPEAFSTSTNGTSSQATTNTSEDSPTTVRRTVTTANGSTALVVISSNTPGLARSLVDRLTVTDSPIDLGLHLTQLPADAYIGAAQADPTDPTDLASVTVIRPADDQGGTDAILTLRRASDLPVVVGSVPVRTLDGHFVTVHVGTDGTSWVLLRDGLAVMLYGYPLSGTMLQDALSYPESTLLPLLAGATDAR